MDQGEYQKLLEKYKAKVRSEFGAAVETAPRKVTSKEYSEFKAELYPTSYTLYEKACNFSGNTLKLGVSPKTAAEIQKELGACHLNTTPSGVISFSILAALMVMVFGSLIMYAVPALLGMPPMMFLVFFCIIAGLLMIPALRSIPKFAANTWRMKASNQMVQSIFYLVTYMRHTSNLERGIEFAADHLDAPLSLDFRKILWDVELQKYSNIRESADAFLGNWNESNKNFVEAFHLVESSLFEGSEERRLSLLDKSLDVILNGTYENMLHYAHSLSSPITMLHMLGIILPILGLVILPLVVSFMSEGSSPFLSAVYISLLYNITLPITVFYIGKTILSHRPAGYGAEEIKEDVPVGKGGKVGVSLGKKLLIYISPISILLLILTVGFIIGFSPLLIHSMNPTFEIKDENGKFKMMDYVCVPCKDGMASGSCGPDCDVDQRLGPFGMGATILSLVAIAALGVGLGLYFALRSKNVIKIREQTRTLEDEFSSALFQLGNRLGDGIPAEIAFTKVAQNMQGTTSGDFFSLAERNMTKLGMGLEQAIFDPKVGAISAYPSKVIESSMKVLVESAKKGPLIAAQALLSMSRYIKEIHTVEERLKDLMAEVLSSMNSQIKFLTPAIAGIVVGITSMIATILTKLSAQLGQFAQDNEPGMMGGMMSIFGVGIPTFHFQIVVGIYIVQITYILVVLANGIDNGADKLAERYSLGKNLIRSTLLYCIISGVVVVLFNLFAAGILNNALGG